MNKTCTTFNDENSLLLNQTVNELRRVIENMANLEASTEVLQQLKQQASVLAGLTAQHQGQKPIPQFHLNFSHDNINAFLPYGPFTGYFNPLAAPVEVELDGEKVIGKINFGSAYEGPPNSVHGGIISGVFDQLLAIATTVHKIPGPTAYLTTNYHLPTPIKQDLRFEAWIDNIEGRKVFVKGVCLAGGETLSSAEGLFIKFNQ